MFDLILGASPVVKAVLIALALASISSWAVILLKYRELSRGRGRYPAVSRGLPRSTLGGRLRGSPRPRGQSDGRDLRAGFEEISSRDPRPAVDRVEGVIRRLEWVRTDEVHRLERGLSFLATIGSSAPFVGLFGTVVGIMNSFTDIGTSGSASLAVVAPGIAEALVATAVGLFAAIPAVIAYNYSSARLTHIGDRLDVFRSEFGEALRELAARAV